MKRKLLHYNNNKLIILICRCDELEDPVFLHTSSVLRSTKPQWIVYQEVFESNGKMYLRGVSAIEPDWIPLFCKTLCKLENPLKDPPPFFNKDKGDVYCSVKATYGKQGIVQFNLLPFKSIKDIYSYHALIFLGWELPIVETEYPIFLEKFKLFAQFLLEGLVFPKLGKWREKLLSMPITMTKPWAKLQPRTQTLLLPLTKNGIHSKSLLEERWKLDQSFLLSEYLTWLPDDIHNEVKSEWPPIESSVV